MAYLLGATAQLPCSWSAGILVDGAGSAEAVPWLVLVECMAWETLSFGLSTPWLFQNTDPILPLSTLMQGKRSGQQSLSTACTGRCQSLLSPCAAICSTQMTDTQCQFLAALLCCRLADSQALEAPDG